MLLDEKIADIINNAYTVRTKIASKYLKGTNLYGSQDATLGIYFDMLVTAISVQGLGENFKLELYKKLMGLLRDNKLGASSFGVAPNPPGTGLAFYYGSADYDIPVVDIQAYLTRDISIKKNKAYRFSPTLEVFILAYPVSYGTLGSILDQNQFETKPGWDVTTESFTIDGIPVDYFVWRFKTITRQVNFINNFIFEVAVP